MHGRLATCSEPAVCDAAGAADSTCITAMTVSPNRRLLALAERCGERPTVTVYDLTTGKKRKVLSQTEAGTKASVL